VWGIRGITNREFRIYRSENIAEFGTYLIEILYENNFLNRMGRGIKNRG